MTKTYVERFITRTARSPQKETHRNTGRIVSTYRRNGQPYLPFVSMIRPSKMGSRQGSGSRTIRWLTAKQSLTQDMADFTAPQFKLPIPHVLRRKTATSRRRSFDSRHCFATSRGGVGTILQGGRDTKYPAQRTPWRFAAESGTGCSIGCQARTNQRLVVAGEDVSVGIGGMCPANALLATATSKLHLGRFDELRAADFIEPCWR